VVYDEADHANFNRPDYVHHEALRWLERLSEPFLYLIGFSGTGKSSLLQAWLAPELARREPPMRTVVAHTVHDPIGQLVDALTRPDVVWDKPPSTGEVRLLVERATEHEEFDPARARNALDDRQAAKATG
jgi:hypothetical protein